MGRKDDLKGTKMLRLFAMLAMMTIVAACTNPDDLDEAPVYLGDFNLAHNVVVAPNLTRGPVSREATEEEWIEAMTSAIDERFGRYEGTRLYHLGISVEGYVLAIPGLPLVASPRSALILRVTVWDDAKQEKLNAEPHQVTVVESMSPRTMLGSGLTQTKAQQMRNLSRNAAKLIQNWLVRENAEKGWFEGGERGRAEALSALQAIEAAEAAEAASEAPGETPEPASDESDVAPEEDIGETPVTE
jgi:hypothetical protein